MPSWHQNITLSLWQGCIELQPTPWWGIGCCLIAWPGWELVFSCTWMVKKAPCMLWSFSTPLVHPNSCKSQQNQEAWASYGPRLDLCPWYGTWCQMRTGCVCCAACQKMLCTMCNLFTSQMHTYCHIRAEIWPIIEVWPHRLISQHLMWCTKSWLLRCYCSVLLYSVCVVYMCEQN